MPISGTYIKLAGYNTLPGLEACPQLPWTKTIFYNQAIPGYFIHDITNRLTARSDLLARKSMYVDLFIESSASHKFFSEEPSIVITEQHNCEAWYPSLVSFHNFKIPLLK